MRLAFFIIEANELSKINFRYAVLPFIFFSAVVLYLHEPLVVKTVELHELLLYARWPPQAVHLWP